MLEIFVVLALTVLNGVFALSELSIVSARKGRLKAMADQGRAGAASALKLAEDPGRLLSTVQIGITLIGIMAGTVSGATLSEQLEGWLIGQGLSPGLAQGLAYGIVIGAITYLSVVVGELVPKRIALRDPEGIACRVAPLMSFVEKLVSPFVWLLDASSTLVFSLFSSAADSGSTVTHDEIKTLVAEAESAGVIEGDESRMISGVLRLGERTARALMTPRMEVEWVDVKLEGETMRERLLTVKHSRILAADGDTEHILGVIELRDLAQHLLRGDAVSLADFVRKAPIVPDTADALDAVEALRESDVPLALVYDEYGHFEGIVTPADILDAIAGAFRSDLDTEPEEAVQREDGSWLIEGAMPADEFAELLGIKLPEKRFYETAAGMLISIAQDLPKTGDVIDAMGWRFEILDLDGRRIDKIGARRLQPPAPDEGDGKPALS